MLDRLRWAIQTTCHAEPRFSGARRRLLWHDFIVHALLNRGHERCQDCGRRTGGWWLEDQARWDRVVGGPWGLLCRPCFTLKESAHGPLATEFRNRDWEDEMFWHGPKGSKVRGQEVTE